MPNRLTTIYTRTGDEGTTHFQGQRMSKGDYRIEAIGTLDELMAVMGLLHSQVATSAIADVLSSIQHRLFDLGAELHIAGQAIISAEDVMLLEKQLDHFNQQLTPLKEFLLPQGSLGITLAHFARTVARRTERTFMALHQHHPIKNKFILAYINRLSDLLFVIARQIAKENNIPEIMWRGLKK